MEVCGRGGGVGGGGDREREVFGVARGGDFPGGIGAGQAGDRGADFLAVGGVGLRGAGRDGEDEGDVGTTGHADFRAHEPIGRGFQFDGRTGRDVGGRRERDGEKKFTLVAVANRVAGFVFEGEWGGPLDFTGGPAGREIPFERGGEAGAGVEPIGVPVGVVDEPEGDGERLAGLDGGVRGDERRFDG